MTNAQRADYVARDAILKLLSNEELDRVSSAESSGVLCEGAEYLDLQQLDRGVQRAAAEYDMRVGSVLPRSAIGNDTWTRILAELAA